MGNTLSRCCGRESKPPKQKRKSKQSELEIALCERSKIGSYMGLPLADRPKDVSYFVYVFVRVFLLVFNSIYFLPNAR